MSRFNDNLSNEFENKEQLLLAFDFWLDLFQKMGETWAPFPPDMKAITHVREDGSPYIVGTTEKRKQSCNLEKNRRDMAYGYFFF